MGKYDASWAGISDRRYNQNTIPAFKHLYNEVYRYLHNNLKLDKDVADFKTDPKLTYPGFAEAINDWKLRHTDDDVQSICSSQMISEAAASQ